MTQDWKLTVTMKDFGSGSGDAEIMDALAARLAGKFSAQFFWYNGEKPAEFTHDGKGIITSTVFDAKIQNDLPDWWEDSFPADRDFEVVVNEENGEDEIRWQFAHGRCTSCVRGGEELVEQGGEDSTEFNIGGWCGQLYAKSEDDGTFLAVTDSGLLVSGHGRYWKPIYVKIPGKEQESGSPDAYTKRKIVEDYVIPYIKNGKKISLDQCAYYDEDEDVDNFDVYGDFLNNDDIVDADELPFQQQFIAVAWMLENDTYGGIEPYHYDEADADNIDDGDFEIEDGILQSYSGSDSSISIPEDVTEIGEKAFSDCTSLASVTIPEGVTKIGGEAFRGCTALASVTIPASVVTISRKAFEGCTSLAEIHFTGSKEQWTLVGKGEDWNKDVPAAVIHCTDGDELTKDSELIIEDGVLKKYEGKAASITIPGIVTKIGDMAFMDCTSLAAVTIPASVTEIEEEAFYGCTALTEIHYGGSRPQWFELKKGKNWNKGDCNDHVPAEDVLPKFSGEESSIDLPEGMTRIGNSAFYGFTSLKTVSIPESVTEIDKEAFSGCTALASISIPEGVTAIGKEAFKDCASLTSIKIPVGVTAIGKEAFSGCTALAEIHFGGSKDQWAAVEKGDDWNRYVLAESVSCSDGNVEFPQFELTDGTLKKYLGAAPSFTIPAGVTEIGNEAFAGCTALASVTIPESVTKIGNETFMDCAALTSVTIPGSVTEIGGKAFRGCTALTSVTIPGSVTEIVGEAFRGCTAIKEVRFGGTQAQWFMLQGYKEVPENATVHCSDGKGISEGMSEVTIPEGVTEISGAAFRNCTALTSVNIPASVSKIGYNAFYGCTALASVTIPEGVMEIGEEAFYGCTALASVTIPEGVTEIGSDAFYGCTALAEIHYGGTKEQWAAVKKDGDWNFHLLAASVTCTDGDAELPLFNIADGKLKKYLSLAPSAAIPEGVTEIGRDAFYGCKSLASVTIPEGVTKIGGSAFKGCTTLASIIIPEGVMEIGDEAFDGCTTLASVSIPEGVTKIGKYAFYGCTALASVVIPDSVTKIGDEAFDGCTALAEIHYTGTKEQWAAVEKGKNWNKGVPAKEVLVRKQ